MYRQLLVVALFGLVASLSPALAQPEAAFTVASVKPSPNGSGPGTLPPLVLPQPGRLTARNATLRALARTAYGVEDFQIEGGPAWTSTERFDIVATADPASPVSAIPIMLRALLLERFGLKAHVERRDVPAFALTRARNDGTVGPDLRPTTIECSAPGSRCGVAPFSRNGGFAMRGTGQDLSVLTRLLSQAVGEPVIDRTGLTGLYDFELAFDMSDLSARAARSGLLPPGVAAGVSDNPPLLTAVQEQMGLKLERERAMVDMVVIDAATMPAAD